MTPRRCLREALERIYAEDGVWTDSLAALIKAAEAVLDEGTQPDGAAMLRAFRAHMLEGPAGAMTLGEAITERNRLMNKIDELLARAPKVEQPANTELGFQPMNCGCKAQIVKLSGSDPVVHCARHSESNVAKMEKDNAELRFLISILRAKLDAVREAVRP